MTESKVIFEKQKKIVFNHDKKLPKNLMCIIAGPTGIGKTSIMLKIFTSGLIDANNIIIFTHSPNQAIYQILLHGINNNLSKNIIQAIYDNYIDDIFECNFLDVCIELSEDENNLNK